MQILQYHYLLFKASMFILLLEWLLIILAIKFHVRESKRAWSDYKWYKVQTRVIKVHSVHSIHS